MKASSFPPACARSGALPSLRIGHTRLGTRGMLSVPARVTEVWGVTAQWCTVPSLSPCPDATSACPSPAGAVHGQRLPLPAVFHANPRGKRALAGLGVSPTLCMAREGGRDSTALRGVPLFCCTCRGRGSHLLPGVCPPPLPAGHRSLHQPLSCPRSGLCPLHRAGESRELPRALPMAHTPHRHRVWDPNPKILTPGPCWDPSASAQPFPCCLFHLSEHR